ncbi:MAG: extracellular solute-binding protein [Rhodobacteraceae bacterium]|nr:extracellular solute-binding protein [Paracoccaceae bacterium]
MSSAKSAQIPHGRLYGKPEGPYESTDRHRRHGISNEELEKFLDFVEQYEVEAENTLSAKAGIREIRLLAVLMRNHLTGKLSTSSALIASSGLSYGTGMRSLKGVEERGLLIRRPRTETGKSFSLHPSQKLIDEWYSYARRVRALVGGTFGIGGIIGDSEYFYGASYSDGYILPPPPAMDTKLALSRNLRLLVHADPTFMALQVLNKQFSSIFGIGISIRSFSIDRLHHEILRNAKADESQYDIVACDMPWFGEMADAGHFLPLDDLMQQGGFDSSDFHDAAMASARYKGSQFGIPVLSTPELLVYRSDIFENAGLPAPQTIEETLTAARTIHNGSYGMSGLAWNAARGTPLGHSFMFVCSAFGRPVLNLRRTESGFDAEHVSGAEMRPMLDSEEARATAEYFRELLSYSPRGILNMSWYERARCYADGQAGMAYCATLLAPLFELDHRSPAHGATEYVAHPCGLKGQRIAPLGGYGLAIPSNVGKDQVQPIWTALSTLTSAPAVKLYVTNGSLANPRYSVGNDPEVKRISPLISIVDEMARFGVLQMWPRPPVPEIADVFSIVGEEIHDMLLGVKSTSEALSNSQNRVDALMRSNGHY